MPVERRPAAAVAVVGVALVPKKPSARAIAELNRWIREYTMSITYLCPVLHERVTAEIGIPDFEVEWSGCCHQEMCYCDSPEIAFRFNCKCGTVHEISH